jgi:predicted MFS family arabinose efflux permease
MKSGMQTKPTLRTARRIPLGATISALGIAQIISWGSLYYAIAVLGDGMRRDLGVSQPLLFGAFTFSLLLSGLAAPATGKLIDARGGRVVLSAGSCIGAVALALLASATGPATLLLGSAAAGIAMAACLYDPAFITLNQISGESYRKSVTTLTLFGGFASTVFWPLSQFLLDAVGWRGTLLIYAAMQLMVCLPLHGLLLPAHRPAASDRDGAAQPALLAPAASPTYAWLSAAFAIGSFVLSVLSVHLIGMFKSAGVDAGNAVFIASLVGPMQVLGRIIELAFARKLPPVAVGTVSFVLIPLALLALFFVQGMSPLAIIAAALFGLSNGLMTIVRGTVPAALFGREGYGLLLGRLARPAFIARALAPAAFPLALTAGLVHGKAVLMLAACGGLSLAAYQLAVRKAAKPPRIASNS